MFTLPHLNFGLGSRGFSRLRCYNRDEGGEIELHNKQTITVRGRLSLHKTKLNTIIQKISKSHKQSNICHTNFKILAWDRATR